MSVVEDIVTKISGMTALELSELKTALEDKFGVTAAAPMMGMPMMMGGGDAGGGAAAEEKTEFDVILKSGGDQKLQVIRVVREITGLGLKEAKDLVDGAPNPVKEGIGKDEAEKIAAQLKEAGGAVEVK